ncbi:MAG: Pr6Pr family membrane protein, partial [Microbacteriaceae bacterium]|nr:Pr6Pr family membrane protein [Microbacteriaceae bacterium]
MTVTSPLGEKAAADRLSTLRHIAGIISIVAGLLVLAALITQITDQISVGRFEPTEYFAYFTIQTAMINIVVMIAGGIMAFWSERDTPLYTAIRASIFSYAIVTGVVYNLLMRDIHNDDGYVGPV